MAPQEREWVLAEFILDCFEGGLPRSHCTALLAAFSRIMPSERFRTAWRTLGAWAVRAPPNQAPALPVEALLAIMAALF
eukprot:2564316-Lingulodinium_polyedra.AAC.1